VTSCVWIPGPLPGMNEMIAAAKGSGGRGRAYSAMKKKWSAEAASRAIGKERHLGRVLVSFAWYEPNRKRDLDNVAAAKKFILDGLVTAGVIKSDGWSTIAALEDDFYVNENRPGCLVTIEDSPT
jgi:hypothetical protein